MNHDHHTFFGKIIGKPFDALVDAIKHIGENAKHDLLGAAIAVTQAVKTFVTSKAADVITSIIPGNIDDSIADFLRKQLPLLLADELALKTINESTSEEDAQKVMQQIVDSFGGLSDDKKEQFYTSIGANVYKLLLQVEHGEKITFGQGAKLVEEAYQEYVKMQSGD